MFLIALFSLSSLSSAESTYAAIEPDTKPTEPSTAAPPGAATAASATAAATADDTNSTGEDAESGQGRQAEGPHDGVRVLCTNVQGGAQEEAPGGECDLCRVLEKVRRAVEGQYREGFFIGSERSLNWWTGIGMLGNR